MLETEMMMKPYLWLQIGDDSIQVEQEIVMMCQFIRQELASQNGIGSSKNRPICLPEQVRTPALLNSILNYCRFHQTPGRSIKERKSYDDKLIRIMDTNSLCELVTAANSLQLKPLIDLICRALARRIEASSLEEIRDMFDMPDNLTEEEKLEPVRNVTCNTSIRLLNRLLVQKLKILKERESVLENLQQQHRTNVVNVVDERVVDERPVDELLLFINGSSNDEEPKRKKTCKNKKKNRRKEKEQEKKSSLKEVAVQHNKKEEDDPIMAKIDREVEEFERRLNTDWSERRKELLRRC